MTTNRSSEELLMREHVEAWGRKRWPSARVFHELVAGECRIDIAFICPNDLIGVEIKSSKDVLTRLDKQARVFRDCFPEFWVAIAPKWKDSPDKPYFHNEIVVGEEGIVPSQWHSIRPQRNKAPYNAMLGLLWADEARAIAARKGCLSGKRTPLHTVLPELALRLTGAEILNEVCRELRGRSTKFKADEPIRLEPQASAVPNLFRSEPALFPQQRGAE
ncbi:hypothetical protein JQ628_11550 [Bradyrhizobium lablabi]|uniref:hypothetical protein n=1 Tax=Bradyrhizobium lablabi TaxID=722472 RepID=UPI001BA66E54|nr:hypothetical protein [Bradyrhizobium lablabi]MBR1122151.1 hypothetical protein [Bradyrhizobium lablabi]